MKYFRLFFLLFSTIAFCQDYKMLWSETVQDELNGKTQSAYKKTQNIYALAKKESNEEQIIKCFFYISKFRQTFDEKSQVTIISSLREEIAVAKPTSRAILNYIYGEILSDFLKYHFYKIKNTTTVQGNPAEEIAVWSVDDFTREINKSFSEALVNTDLLYNTPINNFGEILEIPPYVDGKSYSLYELLHNEISLKYLKLLKNTTLYSDNTSFLEAEITKLYSKTSEFTQFKTSNTSLFFQPFIKLLQQKELYIQKTNPNLLDSTVYKRLLTIDQFFNMPETINQALNELEKSTNNKNLYYELRLRKIKQSIQFSNKVEKPNALKEAINELDEIIKLNPNEYITTEAQLEKEGIKGKHLFIKLNETNYEGENSRAFVEFKNVDALKVSYYKIPTKDYLTLSKIEESKKNEIIKFINGKKPFKESTKTIPNPKNHYPYSTEILIDKLPLGYYLIVFEDTDIESNEQIGKDFSLCHITNISYSEDRNRDNDLFYLLDRKTGKPLPNAYLNYKKHIKKADSNGKIIYPKRNERKTSGLANTYLIADKDTLAFDYLPSIKYNKKKETEEEFEAKAIIYLDRAIYRPGQKVFFKGILIQDKDNKKSVVPYVTVNITIEGEGYSKIKELDLQTNEFGSFSGEFDIPKNCKTGTFEIEIDKPVDEFLRKDKKYYNKELEEHSFWQNANLDYSRFLFQVEEYKRPTFEISVDKIKEVYSINDSVILQGHIKNLSGSSLANTPVKYSISRSYQTNRYQRFEELNYIQKETTTDSEGAFNIPVPFSVENSEKNTLNSSTLKINIEATDSNGETRTIEHIVFASKESLRLDTHTKYKMLEEDKNHISVTITNIDEHPIPYQGKIEIYKAEKSNYLKARTFDFPDLLTISEEDFKKLFPHEPYKSINENKLKLLDSIPFSTHDGNKIALPKLSQGDYVTTTSIIDSKNNVIKRNNNFEINSNENSSSHNNLFSFKRINIEDENKIHFEFNTLVPELYITTRMYDGDEIIAEKITVLINGKGIASFDKLKNPKYNYNFFFSTQWENTARSEDTTILKEISSRKIDFEVISFRNKIEPGNKENWSFKINNNKLETEVLASMYDTSLDIYAKSSWKKISFDNYKSAHYPYISKYNIKNINFTAKTKKTYYQKINFTPYIQWFGFDYSNPKKNNILKQYEENVARPQIIRLGAKTITGVISDVSGPIPGANVVIQGTTIGVQTNFDGSYAINAKEGEKLVISFMGMNEVIKTVSSSNVINTVLQDDTQQLKEVVIGAVGIKRDERIYNPNIIVITSNDKDLSYFKKYNSQIINALRGRVSGLSIEDEEGIKSKKSAVTSSYTSIETIVTKGNSSASNNNNALLIIDGEIKENLSIKDISPEDITSITIIKDKEATNLYGEKGKNGVILIITKNAIKELDNIKARQNFNETAFFYPHIRTDYDGKISFSFTTPESLTRWRLRLFGHNKKAENGYFESEIISQKELMVMPNMPRFLRENDTIRLSAKVVNMTSETKSGTAILQLYDAATGNLINTECLNSANTKNFSCKPKESTALHWTITIPEGLQGIQYKIVAKSGNFSDGEENILPVLTNKFLVTESMPIWVREKTQREFTLENLKNNDSKTLKNHLFSFEYTSNPTWLALQSLPYLMEYEHECAEQTFARYYANFIAAQIINSNPKIAQLFESWKKDTKKSRLEMNEELKSVILQETPWLFDADEEAKDKHLAFLFDLKKLKDSSEEITKKLEDKQSASGGFAWFKNGSDNIFITQHILSGIGHLNTMFPDSQTSFKEIISKGIPNIDKQFSFSSQKTKFGSNIDAVNLQYLYTRSFYTKSHPLTDTGKINIENQLINLKANWLQYNLYQKAQLALIFNRFGEKEWAKKVITHFKETASHDTEKGMYWIANKNGFYWYESPIETQALIIEAFAEIENDKETIDKLKVWLIKNKQTNNWKTTKATTEAIYALLLQGTNWLEVKDNTVFKIGDEKVLQQKLSEKKKETGTGYTKLNWKANEITKDMATITIENKSDVPGYGGAYWQYFENLENIKSDAKSGLAIQKEVFKKIKDSQGEKLIPIKDQKLVLGDVITLRLIIKTDNDLEFVHLKDLRASCFEPINVLSEYEYKNGLSYYMSTKDIATHFFFDTIKKGTYVLEYDVRVNNQGSFNNGIATLQNMYAPEFNSHSASEKIKVTE